MAFGENVAADETGRFQAFAAEIAAIQGARVAAGAPADRVMHVKQHAGALGELTITAGEGARYGVFAEPGKSFPVYARFSNGSGLRQSDKDPDVRGFALKLVGVPGAKLIEGLENEVTQDFLFINSPVLPFRDPDEFMIFVRSAKDGPVKLLPRLISGFGLGRALGILWGSISAKKVESFATHTFHTAAPIAFGPSAAKLALIPRPADGARPSVSGPDYLRADLAERLRQGALTWSLSAQVFVDEATTPIENTLVEWSGPWLELATLTLPRQDLDSARGQEISALVSGLSFDPWHTTEQHRPLGAIMRARRVTYAPSIIGREASPEPRDVLSP